MIIVPVILTIILLLWWIIEYSRHRNNLGQIPIRIHINGTRGKSSVTRLITWGLIGGGIRVVGKTTGSAPMLIINGKEEPIERVGKPNIKEQLSVVERAAIENAQALVVECMAVDPELQWISERKIIKSTLGVITNVRPDHIESMGPTLERIADALSGTIPKNGVLFTAESELFKRLEANAKELGTRAILVSGEMVSDDEMKNFTYIEHKENVALALAVCEYCGVKREDALRSMWNAIPDLGALKIFHIYYQGHNIYFVNLFAANDPVSTIKIYRLLGLDKGKGYPVIIISNSRSDRLDRLAQYKELLGNDLKADYYILVGGFAELLGEYLSERAIPRESLFVMEGKEPSAIFEKVLELGGAMCAVLGVGNIGGVGHSIVQYFSVRGKECSRLP